MKMKRNLLASTISGLLALSAMPAFAQDAAPAAPADAPKKEEPTEITKITVTGSRIPVSQQETASPTVTITAEEIEKQGYRNVADVLRAQPLATGAVQDNQFTNGFTPGATTISLLSLDPSFTLILMDGRPLADYPLLYNGQSNFTDLSTIPTAMVERIDILPGNQSAIYGSAAIAGVVNIILKKHIEGYHLNARIGGYDNGGGDNFRLEFTGGKQFGALDLTWGLQYSKQDAMFGSDSDWYDSTDDNPDPNSRFGSRTFLILDGFSGAYIDPGQATCDSLSGNFDGTTIRDFRPGRGYYCGSRYEVGNTSFLNKEDSKSAYLNANWAVSDNSELYANVLFNWHKTVASSSSRFWSPDINGSGGYIWEYDPDNPTCTLEFFDCPLNLYQHIFSPEETGGPQEETFDSKSYNIALGWKGTFGDTTWDWDAWYARSSFKVTDTQMWPLTDAIEGFFQDQFLGPNLGTYYGYQIYNPNHADFYQSLTPGEYASFLDEIRTESKTWTQNINFLITNTALFTLPAGDVGMALLATAGKQSWENPTDQRVISGDFWGLTGTQGEGERTNHAFAAEFRIPLFKQLTASLSGRYDHYENVDAGDDSKATWKLGLEYRPIETLLLRGNYATAFRAPDMAAVFAGDSGFFTSASDYYRCEEDGQPINDCDFAPVNVQGRRSGNPDLKSITADSFGYGFVWSPNRHLTFRGDYYDISIENEVRDLSLDFILRNENECRQGRSELSAEACADFLDRVDRTSPSAPVPNAITLIRTNPVNISTEHVAGISAGATFRWGGGNWGNYMLDFEWNHTLEHDVRQFPDDPELDYLRDGFWSSEFQSNLTADLNWAFHDFDTNLHVVHYGRTANYTEQLGVAENAGIAPGQVNPWTLMNLSVGYNVTANQKVALTINNLANRRPPTDKSYTAYPYYNIFNYNGYGRAWWLSYTIDWGESSD
jgi:outer membrane receptor protein involved in Fe transport